MPWLLTSPGHQQPWYWLCRIGRSLSYSRRNFKYMCLISVDEYHITQLPPLQNPFHLRLNIQVLFCLSFKMFYCVLHWYLMTGVYSNDELFSLLFILLYFYNYYIGLGEDGLSTYVMSSLAGWNVITWPESIGRNRTMDLNFLIHGKSLKYKYIFTEMLMCHR